MIGIAKTFAFFQVASYNDNLVNLESSPSPADTSDKTVSSVLSLRHHIKMANKDHEPFILTPLDSICRSQILHQIFFFPRSKDKALIVQNLTSALAQTLEAIPLLAGTIKTFARERQIGRAGVTAPWRTADEILTVQDLTQSSFPKYETLHSRHFPVVDIECEILMPHPKPGSLMPVFMAQANFIKGGLILAVVLDHTFTDGNGSVSVMKVWAAYCRGDDGVRAIAADSLDRTRLMEGTATSVLDEFPEYTYVRQSDNSVRFSSNHQRLSQVFQTIQTWTTYLIGTPISLGYGILRDLFSFLQAKQQTIDCNKDVNSLAQEVFFFPRAKLNELKVLAAKGETSAESAATDWISTNDALASLLWSCIVTTMKKRQQSFYRCTENQVTALEQMQRSEWLAKLPTLGKRSPTEPVSVLAFALNGRRLMEPPLTPDYVVSCNYKCYLSQSV